ncbi:MAG: hypothetical protein WKF59_08275 [Chitinophagaceae bacterium]
MSAHTVAKDFQENILPKTRHTYPEFARTVQVLKAFEKQMMRAFK